MPVHIKLGGAWQQVDAANIKPITGGGAWRVPNQIHVKVAGAWKACLASGPTVSAQANGANNFRFAANCYAGVEFRVDGTEWECLNTGVWSSPQGDWLDSGNAADVWVECIVTAGSFNSIWPGTGRHQLSSTRSFRLVQTSQGTRIVTCYFKFWDAASGGNLLQQTTSVSWMAERENI